MSPFFNIGNLSSNVYCCLKFLFLALFVHWFLVGGDGECICNTNYPSCSNLLVLNFDVTENPCFFLMHDVL